MANPERGQVALQVGDTRYRLQLSFNALAVLKKQTGLSLQGVFKAFREQNDDPDFELVQAVIWASMHDHHPDVTFEQAGALVPDGGIEELIETLQALFQAAMPKASRQAAQAANPPKATTKAI